MSEMNYRRAISTLLAAVMFLSACANVPLGSRDLANERRALTPDQIASIQEVGIGIFKLSLLSNRVQREADISTDLKSKLERIGINGEPRPGNIGVIASGTAMALLLTSAGYGAGRLSIMKSPVASIRAFNRATLMVAIGSSAIGAAISMSESSNSSASINRLRRNGAKNKALDKADLQTQEAFREFETHVKDVTATYASIFSLKGDVLVILEQEIRKAALDEGARPGGHREVKIDVAQIMLTAGLIDRAQHEDFIEITTNLETSVETKADVDLFGNGSEFGRNLALAKTTIETYVGWLNQAKVGLDAADQKVVSDELVRIQRLLLKLNDEIRAQGA